MQGSAGVNQRSNVWECPALMPPNLVGSTLDQSVGPSALLICWSKGNAGISRGQPQIFIDYALWSPNLEEPLTKV